MTKFGQVSLINFLKKAKSRITSTEIQKIYTKNLRHQKTQLKEKLKC